MKILHISNYYYPHIGGIEQVARDCVQALEGKCEQRVLCFHHEKGDVTSQVDGVTVVRAGCFAKISSQSLSFSIGKLLRREMNSFRPDLVIFHYPNPFVAFFLLPQLKKYPCKFILWWHLDITKQKILGKFFVGQSRKLLKRADRVIATSPNYIDGSRFLSAFREKCCVIPCCAGDARIEPSAEARELAQKIRTQYSGRIICFSCGRHVPYKGLEHLVGASRHLGKEYAVLIGGSGPLTQQLKELAKGDDKVIFLGRLSDAELQAYLLACDIYCFPSVTKNEAFGIALAEAMAYGKPAVTFTIPGSGVNYVNLKDVTGLEVANGDDAAYARAIVRIAEDPALYARLSQAAAKRVHTLFTQEIFRENVRNLIASFAEQENK